MPLWEKLQVQMIIKIHDFKYIILDRKGFYVGEGTESEDLWNKGFRFRMRRFLGIKYVEATACRCQPMIVDKPSLRLKLFGDSRYCPMCKEYDSKRNEVFAR